jgi:hypothetical protein
MGLSVGCTDQAGPFETCMLRGTGLRVSPRNGFGERPSLLRSDRDALMAYPWSCAAQRVAFLCACARRSADTEARKATVRCFGRSDRSAQQPLQPRLFPRGQPRQNEWFRWERSKTTTIFTLSAFSRRSSRRSVDQSNGTRLGTITRREAPEGGYQRLRQRLSQGFSSDPE